MQANLLMALLMLMTLVKVSRRLTDETTSSSAGCCSATAWPGSTTAATGRCWPRPGSTSAGPPARTASCRRGLLTVAVADLDGFRLIKASAAYEPPTASLSGIARVLRDNLHHRPVDRWGDGVHRDDERAGDARAFEQVRRCASASLIGDTMPMAATGHGDDRSGRGRAGRDARQTIRRAERALVEQGQGRQPGHQRSAAGRSQQRRAGAAPEAPVVALTDAADAW